MRKPPRPSTVDKIRAQQAAQAPQPPPFSIQDLTNLVVAARQGLHNLPPNDLVNVSVSIAAAEGVINHDRQRAALAQAAAQAAGQAQPAAPAATDKPPGAAEAAKG